MKRELLFITITNRYSRYVPAKKQVWDVFHFDHIGRQWSTTEHQVSPEKRNYTNCYDYLTIGSSYILMAAKHDDLFDVINGERKYRWVWSGAVEMTEAQLRKIAAFHKRSGDIRETLKFADSVKYPKPTDLADEFEWI